MNVKTLSEEAKYLLGVILVVIVILKIAFYKESFFNVIKFGIGFVYFSLLPGYFILSNIGMNKMDRSLRTALAFPLGFAVYAIIAYYLNIFVSLSVVVWVPLVVIGLAIAYSYYASKSTSENNSEKRVSS